MDGSGFLDSDRFAGISLPLIEQKTKNFFETSDQNEKRFDFDFCMTGIRFD